MNEQTTLWITIVFWVRLTKRLHTRRCANPQHLRLCFSDSPDSTD